MLNRIYCASVILVILGIGFLVGGILLIALGDSVLKNAIKKECQLSSGTFAYKIWRDPPVPFYISIYVFDLNDTEFLNGSAKPRLRQRGPFVYKEERKKINIRDYPNETISYQETRSYTFVPERSGEPENVNITTVNIVYMTLVNYLQNEHVPNIVRRMIGDLLNSQEKPIMQLSVKDYLWGYDDPLLKILHHEFPELVTDDKVSAFNASVSQAGLNTFLINNGVGFNENHVERINNVGAIERFNFGTKLPYWSNDYANMINGTDGSLWHPDVDENERIFSFIPDICRAVYLDFNETNQNTFNIETYRYTLPNTVYSNSTDNEGFCLNSTTTNKTHELDCLPSGLFSLKSCIRLSGSSVSIPLPIIGSNPHFLEADSTVQKSVEGLIPDGIKHRSFIDIEPLTGNVMNGSRRIQININVINDSSITAISHVHPVIYPMIWLDEHAEIDDPSAKLFHKKVTTPITALNAIKYVLLSIGIALILVVIALIMYQRHKKNMSGEVFPRVDDTERLSSHF
ncbi:unnamed protein product [Adineta steineri]|uniref:Uncharacterized protein n=1 Tax=Adineta steineri TaxID=433720 RepID=A0A814H8Q1_9BILA|nr:unnamed protein product [Adineta steineri]CAF1359849.1 unnamed protein product [Adineta steineri]